MEIIMKKIFCFLPFLFLVNGCTSWNERWDSEIVKYENGKNKFIRLEHQECVNWRKKFEYLISENIELNNEFNKVAINCLINGANDSHSNLEERLKKYSDLEKDLNQSPNFDLKKLGHCYGKPIYAQALSAGKTLGSAAASSIIYCSKELQTTFENSKNTNEYLKKIEEISEEYAFSK